MIKNNSDHVTEILKIEGVGCKGFGILPKFVALDTELSIGAKAIYAYFCSLAGSGTCAFPKRDTIISHLGINKDTYYKFYNELLDAGYLTAYQEKRDPKQGFSRNIYTLVQNPERFRQMKIRSAPEADGYDNVYIQGMTQYGYGIIPRLVMMDPRLDIKAKGIYAYYIAHSGAGQYTHLKRGLILKHLGISTKTYYKYLNELIGLNYITTEQKKSEGRFASTTYILNSNPDMEKAPKKAQTKEEEIHTLPCGKISDTQDIVENDEKHDLNHKLPCGKISDTQKTAPCGKISDTQNPDTNNNNNRYTNTPSFPKSLSSSEPERERKKEKEDANGIHMLLDSKMLLREDIKPDYELAQTTLRTLLPVSVYGILRAGEINESHYELFINVLSGMISSDMPMRAKGSTFGYSHVIKRINHIIASSSMPKKEIEFECFAREFLKYLSEVLLCNEVGDIMTYTRSVLWDWLNKYAVQRSVNRSGFHYANMIASNSPPESCP